MPFTTVSAAAGREGAELLFTPAAGLYNAEQSYGEVATGNVHYKTYSYS